VVTGSAHQPKVVPAKKRQAGMNGVNFMRSNAGRTIEEEFR
jgi:hypothetical protein